ncbi:MAG: hypothetical protein H6672_05770 [Anaerolineaceae bacterium]|nr:hypothetical protein [Anaerolineaceae bacterium]
MKFRNGYLDSGTDETRIYAALWPLTAIGFTAAGGALAVGWDWGERLLLAVTLLSVVITGLDMAPAFRGTIISIMIIVLLLTIS